MPNIHRLHNSWMCIPCTLVGMVYALKHLINVIAKSIYLLLINKLHFIQHPPFSSSFMARQFRQKVFNQMKCFQQNNSSLKWENLVQTSMCCSLFHVFGKSEERCLILKCVLKQTQVVIWNDTWSKLCYCIKSVENSNPLWLFCSWREQPDYTTHWKVNEEAKRNASTRTWGFSMNLIATKNHTFH